jgi:hypothetical protein
VTMLAFILTYYPCVVAGLVLTTMVLMGDDE